MTTSEQGSRATMTGSEGEAAVLVERRDGIAILRLNRPEKHNAINQQLATEAMEALDRLEAEDEVRVIVVTGAGGRAFCAGADMAEATGRGERPRQPSGGVGSGLGRRIAACEKPVIGAINGLCYGGGMSIALGCDFRIAADHATFRLPGAAYGLVVAATLLASAVGPAVAKELILTARVFDVQEALRIGLVNRVVPAAELESTVLESARLIAANSPLAVRESKRIVNLATVPQVAVEAEREADRRLRGGDDHVVRFKQAADRVLKRS